MNPIFIFLGLVGIILPILLLMQSFGGSANSAAHKRLKAFEELDLASRHPKTSLFPGKLETSAPSWHEDASTSKKKSDRSSTSVILGKGTPQQQLVLVGTVIGVVAVLLLLINQNVLPRQTQNILPFGVLVVLIPRMVRIMKLKRIRKKFSEQFPAAIRMMMNSLKAGHDIRSSFEMVAEDMPAPISEEFGHILRELNVGVNLEAALKNFQRRLSLSDVNIFVISILLNNKLGGNLTEILLKLEYTMRDRIRLRREINSLTGQAQASAMLLSILAPGVTGYMFMVNPDYMRPLWTTTLGLWVLIGCSLAVMFGAFILFRMTKVSLE